MNLKLLLFANLAAASSVLRRQETSCTDNTNCVVWIQNGFCTSALFSADLRRKHCPRGCNLCPVGVGGEGGEVGGQGQGNGNGEGTGTGNESGGGAGTGGGAETCQDRNVLCPVIGGLICKLGFRGLGAANCPKYCGLCED